MKERSPLEFPHFVQQFMAKAKLPVNCEQTGLPGRAYALNEKLAGGEFIGPDGFQEMRGYPMVVDSDEDSKDPEIAERLWRLSEEQIGRAHV